MLLTEAITKYVAFGQFKNKQSTMSAYQHYLRLLCVHLRNCELEEVTLQHIIDYLNLLKEAGFEETGFLGRCSAWKQFFAFYYKQGYKVIDPEMIPLIKGEYKMPSFMNEEDVQKLLMALEKHPGNIHKIKNQALIHMLHDTGVRLGELRSMKVGDMDLLGMKTIIRTEKKRGGIKPLRMVFWNKVTNCYLKDYIKAREYFLQKIGYEDKDQWLWITARSYWNAGNQWSAVAIEAMLKRLSREAKLGFTANPHRFRHLFGKTLAIKGANQSIIADMMGHASIENTRIYTILNESLMEETHRKYFKIR